MKTPIRYCLNGETPIDGYKILDADNEMICLVDKEDDAVLICNAVNNYGA